MNFQQRPMHMAPVIDALRPPRAGNDAAEPKAMRRFLSQELFGGECQLEIEHGGALYRLRVTSLGKLILTK